MKYGDKENACPYFYGVDYKICFRILSAVITPFGLIPEHKGKICRSEEKKSTSYLPLIEKTEHKSNNKSANTKSRTGFYIACLFLLDI